MEEMKYTKNRNFTIVLDKGQIDGFNYCIVNYGTHPCCYIFLPENHKYYGKSYDDIDIECHGGLTYSDKDLQFNPFVHNYWVIGWDYAHCYDYMGYYEDNEYFKKNNKKWTTKELLEEVKEVIKQL